MAGKQGDKQILGPSLEEKKEETKEGEGSITGCGGKTAHPKWKRHTLNPLAQRQPWNDRQKRDKR